MNMFWSKSKKRIESIDPKLATRVINIFRKAAKDDYYTFSLLLDRVRPVSAERLAIVLSELVKQKTIDRVVRVNSRRGGGIGDYDSIANVPLEVYDRRSDDTFEVTPSDIQILFAPHTEDQRWEHTPAEH
ncbi:hypothetical protein [Edaphobacter flagellatus]|uniref:hypothetical protein n=1 Tax=Edaphobacter flagellatus TaxID=1933044 RepID=UPI0021B308E8|nr:hypothetical protein [Edaphobacter flagellatus]